MEDICRVCANKIKDKNRMRHLFVKTRAKLLENLKLITGVELLDKNGLPKCICERCFSELDLAIKFRERCIFSQTYLKDMLKKDHMNFIPEDLIDEVNDEEVDEKYDDTLQFTEDNSCDESEDEMESPHSANVSNMSNMKKRHLVLLHENHRPKRVRNFFICEECGQFFDQEHDYHEHLESHSESETSTQFFPCSHCEATFTTKILLKQHRRNEHSGNRLFKCSICGETFLEHSAKQRHEIAHRNERPYPCLECSENFTSVSELRMHSTIHTKSKISCEPCNKKFTARRHYDAHLNTRAHIRLMQDLQCDIEILCHKGAEEVDYN